MIHLNIDSYLGLPNVYTVSISILYIVIDVSGVCRSTLSEAKFQHSNSSDTINKYSLLSAQAYKQKHYVYILSISSCFKFKVNKSSSQGFVFSSTEQKRS